RHLPYFTMKLRGKLGIYGVIVIVLVGLGGMMWVVWDKKFGEKGRKEAWAEGREELEVVVKRKTIVERLRMTGEVLPIQSWEVRSEVSGKVREICVRVGDRKEKDEVLVLIDDRDLQTERERAEQEVEGLKIELKKIEANFQRLQQLFGARLASEEAYENMKAERELARNKVARAETNLRTVEDRILKTRIVAPGRGQVLDVKVKEGDVVVGATSVNSGTVMVYFADTSQFIIRFHANQMERMKLWVGQEVVCMLPGREEKVRGRIRFVSPYATVEEEVRGFAVEAVLEESRVEVYAGMNVVVEIPVAVREDALCLPIAAVSNDGEEKSVLVRVGRGVERRRVEVGIADDFDVEIRSGVNEGEVVVMEGLRKG
ncbi:MAG: efflux RND transporter periplasmic adaptor subunit, partial [Chthoniobacterales bacterium]|nr:efflux RND transporter periplasmic adaptor subunit [Chthoniobacterales bacterium]